LICIILRIVAVEHPQGGKSFFLDARPSAALELGGGACSPIISQRTSFFGLLVDEMRLAQIEFPLDPAPRLVL
jgi:hypothetical protein